MDKEYSWNDIIINPASEGVEACIGKKCYFSNNPMQCLNNANKKDNYYDLVVGVENLGYSDLSIMRTFYF